MSHLSPTPMKLTLLSLIIALPLTMAACVDSNTSASADKDDAASREGADEHTERAAHDEGTGKEHEERGHVTLSAEQIEAGGIGLAQAGPATIRETLPLYGIIAPNAERVLDVAARFPGVIRTVSRRIGEPVRQGETLATVESNESLQTYAVVAPLSGVVTSRSANPGEQTGEKVLFKVADLSTVWVELALFSRDVAKVRVGQSVRVSSADAGLEAEGIVIYVAPFGQSTNQTLTARVQLDNPDRRWAPGLYVSADVTLSRSTVPLAIHAKALQSIEEIPVVFVRNAQGFESRPVRLARTDGEISEVLEGVTAGEIYATHNSFILKSELGKSSAAHED